MPSAGGWGQADFALTDDSICAMMFCDKIIKDRILGEFFGAERAVWPDPRT